MASLPPPPLQTTSPYQSTPPPSCSSSLHCPLCNIVFDSPKSLDVHLAYQHDQLANQWALDVNAVPPPAQPPLNKMEYSNGTQDTRLYSSAYEPGPDPFNHNVPPMSQAYYAEPRYDAFVGVNPPRRYHPYGGPGTPFHPAEALNGGAGPTGNHPQCDKCGAVFDSVPALMDHMHTQHASTPTSHSTPGGYPASEAYWAQPGLVGLSGNPADPLTSSNTPTSTPTPKSEGGNEAAEILDLDSHKVHVYQPPGSGGLPPQSVSLHHSNRALAPTPPYTPATSTGSSVGWMTPPPLVHPQQPPTPQNYRRPEESGYNPNNLHAFSGYTMSPGPGPTGPAVPATHSTPPYPSPSPTLAPASRNSPAPNTSTWKASSGGQGGSEAKRPKTYNCEACNKWFTSSGHLKRHYNTTLHKNAVKAGAPDPALRATGRGKKAASQVPPPPPPEEGSGPPSPTNSQDDSQSSSSASNSRGMEDPSKSSQPSPRPPPHTINMSDLSSVPSSTTSLLSGQVQPPPQPLPGMPPMHSPHMNSHPPVSSPLAFAGHIPAPPVHTYGPPPPMGAGSLGNAPFPLPVQGSGPGPGPGPGLVSRLMHPGPGGAMSTGSPYPMAPLQHHVGQHPYYQNPPPPSSSAVGHMGMMHPPRTAAGNTLPPSPSHHPGLPMNMPPYHQQQHSYHNNGGYTHPPNPMAPLLSSGPSNLGSTEHEIYSGAGQSASQTDSILPHHLHNNNNNNNNNEEDPEMVTAEKIKQELQLQPLHAENEDLHGSAEEDMLLDEREGDDNSNMAGDSMEEPLHPLPVTEPEPEHEHENEAPAKRSEDGTFKCTECDKAFNRVCYLTQHNNSFHAGEKPFKCKTCGKRFPDADLFREHQSKHAGEKPYKCELCPKQFNHKTDLRRHMCLHTGEKPFRCEVCRKGFIRKDHMMKHVQTHNRANKAHAT